MELTEQATPMYGKLVRENPKTLCICRLEVRLSEEDMITVKEKANRAGLSISAFIRKLINDTEVKERPVAELSLLIKELNRIGSNINQLVAKTHSLGFVDVPLLKSHLDKLDSLEKLIADIFSVE